MIYHVANNQIISGPLGIRDPYVIKLTRCGTPEVLNIADYGLVPEIKPELGEFQSYGDPIATAESVTFPAIDWTEQQIAEYQAQQVATSREQMSCSPAQGRLALLQVGLLDTVEAWVAGQSRAVQIEYAARTEWRRTWPLVVDAADALGLTEAQLDDLFALAASL